MDEGPIVAVHHAEEELPWPEAIEGEESFRGEKKRQEGGCIFSK